MVSIFTWFTGKKKRKSTSRPTSPSAATTAFTSRRTRPASPARQKSANRFLSLRGKYARLYDAQRRSSAENRSGKSLGVTAKNKEQDEAAPQLAPQLTLGWEGRASGTESNGLDGLLGLDGVGRPPKLKDAEVHIVRSQRWSCEEVMQGWKWFGRRLRDLGEAIAPPQRLAGDRRACDHVLILYGQACSHRGSCFRYDSTGTQQLKTSC